MSRAIERMWARDGAGALLLSPLSWLFGAASGIRNFCYDRGLFRTAGVGAPVVSVGNLSVGGTGKTPVSAWVAAELQAMGAKPAIVMRGYGGDERHVHARVNPTVPVVVNPDRVAGAESALVDGADIIVLDDAFQHRRMRRDLDLVLVAAEQGSAHRLLPAGPLRESRLALRRAQLLVVTRKSASLAEAEATAASWTAFAGAPASCVIALKPGPLRPADPSDRRDALGLGALRGSRVLAISAIGAPWAFEAQLKERGATVEGAQYPDHHAFSDTDIAVLATRAAAADLTVCTLKDAVKLGTRWPRQAPPLWYLSQVVEVERGAPVMREALHRLVSARTS
ncbi:MAG: tetraacyldisaccharide 4'-kinase [Gemmatimonadaceae bacterium]|nr:tetraacyldisaccharide 4'-kinase [Gemmatimonadaceae bacterium]